MGVDMIERLSPRLVCAGLLALVLFFSVIGIAVQPTRNLEAARKTPRPTPIATPTPIPTPTPAPGADLLRLSYSTSRAGDVDLQGATVTGPACVFLSSSITTGPVTFYLDGAIFHTESIAPWDFNGGDVATCTTYDFTLGPHVVRADWPGGTDSSSFTRASVATPTPVPATPTPSPGDPWAVPFGTRPISGPISLVGCHDIIIENVTIRDVAFGTQAIRIENCTNVTVRAVDFINVSEGVFALNSTNITVVDARYSNITGPAKPRTATAAANFVQLNNVSGALIDHNKGKGGDTEDIVSVFQSDNVTVEDNHFEGTNWTSDSSSGIALSDGGGFSNIARRNVLVNPGQVGAFIGGGTNDQITDNIIIGQQRPASNVGIYVWNQSGAPCSGHTVAGNRVHWLNAAGNANPFWNAGNCGTISGLETNVWQDTTLNIEDYRVTL